MPRISPANSITAGSLTNLHSAQTISQVDCSRDVCSDVVALNAQPLRRLSFDQDAVSPVAGNYIASHWGVATDEYIMNLVPARSHNTNATVIGQCLRPIGVRADEITLYASILSWQAPVHP